MVIEGFEETEEGTYEMKSTDVATKKCKLDEFARPTYDAVPIVKSHF